MSALHRPRRVLVTGVGRPSAARLAARLHAEDGIEAVWGVDSAAPGGDLAGASFVPTDVRSGALARVIEGGGVDTVVHLGLTSSPAPGGRTNARENDVIGSMQLLASCQRAPSVRRLVLRSSVAGYGRTPRDPAVATEDQEPHGTSTGYAKDVIEVEGYVRGFARRRPDVDVTVLRFAPVLGHAGDSPVASYLAGPAAPTLLGFDPRLQLLHEDDAAAVLRLAALGRPPGVYNVAGEGVLLLSQLVRRAGRVPVAVPEAALGGVAALARRLGVAADALDQLRLLRVARVVDTRRLVTVFGYRPRRDTAATLDDFLRRRRLRQLPQPVRTWWSTSAADLGAVHG